MLRLSLCALGFTLVACATAKDAVSFSEVMPALGTEGLAPETPKKAPVKATAAHHEVRSSTELTQALASFSVRARHYRAQVPPGAGMPLQQIDDWRDVLGAVDSFLNRRPDETSSLDVIRARITVEAELELDARSYGDFPAEIAEGVVDRANHLAMRMSQLRHLHLKTREAAPSPMAWPVQPVAVTSLYGNRIHPITKKYSAHWGVDLAAEAGQLVSAAGRGTVVRAEWCGGYGLSVDIEHPGGLLTRYGHLSQLLVEVGTAVDKGDPVGLAGNTGLSTGPHLHFEMRRYGKPVDPLEEISAPEAGSFAAL